MKTNELLPVNGLTELHWKPIHHRSETRSAYNDGSTFGEILRTHLTRYILIGLGVMLFLLLLSVSVFAQDNGGGSFLKPVPANYQVKQALEVESLVPMFLTGGYHFAVGYRYRKFRVRVSVINGGTFNADAYSINNSSSEFKRRYNTSPGIFFGYNIWKNLELYTYLESHTFAITQTSTGIIKDVKSTDTGVGLAYQFFIGRSFYIQPGVHLYLRSNKTVDFGDAQYHIPTADITPVIRLGFRLWKQFPK